MKKKALIVMTAAGFLVLLGGLLLYGLGIHKLVPVPRPDLLVVGTSLLGISLIISGVCDLFTKKTKEMEIEEKDERNVAAMAVGFKTLNVTIGVSIFALIFTGYMTVVPCLTIIIAYTIGQIVYVARLWYLNKTM